MAMRQVVDRSVFVGRIGAATCDISPPAGIFFRNWGAAKHDESQGNHRRLEVSVMAIGRGEGAKGGDGAAGGAGLLLLVAIDLGWFTTPETIDLLCKPLEEIYGVPAANVMVCLGHSHATASMAVADAGRPGGQMIAAYADHVVSQLKQAAAEAVASMTRATLSWRYGRCDLATNRDLPDPAGKRVLTGYNPDAAADDTLLVGRAARLRDGKVIATVVNYACHPTTLAWQNVLVSPDYVGAMREVVQEETGGVPCLFLQGASGELSPAYQYVGDVSVADRHGRRLGHAAASVLLGMNPPGKKLAYEGAVESGAVLAQWGHVDAEVDETVEAVRVDVALPLKARETLAELDATLAACEDRALKERLLRRRRRLVFLGDGRTHFEVPVTAWRVGPAVLVGHPTEAYSAYQEALRAAMGGLAVAVINLANGTHGYVVPGAQCDDGLYTWWVTQFDKPSFDLLCDASLETLRGLTGDLM